MEPKRLPPTSGRQERYVPSLDGIRGYGFLLIFCAHYLLPSQLAEPGTHKYRLISSLQSLAVFALPGFFVLSGFLIGGILYGTRNREGFFKVFYGRRVLRIFPVYYAALLAIYIFYKLHGIAPTYRFWVHWIYIQNLLPDYEVIKNGPVGMLHFWSLAVEEQFYMLWPLVVWFFPERKKLLKIVIGLFLCSSLLRAAGPFLTDVAERYVCFTPTAVGPVLLGVALSLVRDHRAYQKLQWLGKWVVFCGSVLVLLFGSIKGREWASTFWGEELIPPITCILAVALIVAIQEEGSMMQRLFSLRFPCWLGKLSYSAYVIHLIFAPYFFHVISVRFSMYMRPHLAVVASAAVALCLTILLSMISGLCIEGPALMVKSRLRYGPERRPRAASGVPDELLPSSAD